MGRFLVFIEDCKTGFKDEWVIFAKDEPSAMKGAFTYAKEHNMDSICVLWIEYSDDLIDTSLLSIHYFEDEEMRVLIDQICLMFEDIIMEDPDIFDYVESCAVGISDLIDYAAYAMNHIRPKTKISKEKLTEIMQCIFLDCKALLDYGMKYQVQNIIYLVTQIYTKFAARAVYNFKKEKN